MTIKWHIFPALAALLVAGSVTAAPPAPRQAQLGARKLMPVEQFTLGNGLKAVFHIDRSDPVVAVSLNAHVGSAREEPGRTGFAHLFEHLFFLNSENLGPGGLDAMSARIGGSGANGTTSRDITDYLQTVPSDALEKMIWAEADKLGFFITTVNEAVLAKEKQVVKNEKRQSYDNQPYGHLEPIVAQALYPAGHPYSWPVIGSLKDLDKATLDDVRGFYRRWYTPGNVTLVIAGDFNPLQARRWVEKYFSEFPRGPAAPVMEPRPAALATSKLLLHEDNFAQLPQLALIWPTVPGYHPDSYALRVLFDLLADGKDTPLHATLVDELKLTGGVDGFVDDGKLAGELYLIVRAFDGIDLDRVKAGIERAFARFEAKEIDPADLDRAKTSREVGFYSQIDSVLGKASRLARYDLYTGNADFADRDIANIRGVTSADVMRVYNRYIKNRPFVAASLVPKGRPELALRGSLRASVEEEAIVQGAEAEVASKADSRFTRTPSKFDRTVEPAYGKAPLLNLPEVWQASFDNGLTALGIESDEIPMADFELSIRGGRLLDSLDKPGMSNLLARMLTHGTARRTPAELEEALKSLGADISIVAGDETFLIGGRTLARNFDQTIDLVEEMLFEPRWDEGELALVKAATASEIQDEMAQPDEVAARLFDHVTYGGRHIYSRSRLGTEASVQSATMEDLKRWHASNLAPNAARFRIVGAVDRDRAKAALADLGARWRRRDVAPPLYARPAAPRAAKLYFYDFPGAKQSIFAFGNPGPRRTDPDFYPASAMNYILGGGGFASRLTQQLREGKGYTYGIRSAFDGDMENGTFTITSGVRSNVTLEAAQLTRSILTDYAATFMEADLTVTKSFLSKSRAHAFETPGAKLRYLALLGEYGLPPDHPHREQAIVDGLTVARVRSLAERYVRPGAMAYVIVGDAATQAPRLKALGLGEPVMIREAFDQANR